MTLPARSCVDSGRTKGLRWRHANEKDGDKDGLRIACLGLLPWAGARQVGINTSMLARGSEREGEEKRNVVAW